MRSTINKIYVDIYSEKSKRERKKTRAHTHSHRERSAHKIEKYTADMTMQFPFESQIPRLIKSLGFVRRHKQIQTV